MIKAFIKSLITAAVFFALGGISIMFFGTKESDTSNNTHNMVTETVDLSVTSETLIDETVTGKGGWVLPVEDVFELKLSTSGVKTTLVQSNSDDDDDVTINAVSQSGRAINVEVNRRDPYDGYLEIEIKGGSIFGFSSAEDTVEIRLPDKIYDELDITVGSGSFSAENISAYNNNLNLGSGSFVFEQKEGFTADTMELDIGSGNAKILSADTNSYDIDMGSGSFDISGLTGSGYILIGSGKGTAEFANLAYSDSCHIDIGSGSLDVYLNEKEQANISAEIGSGSVEVNCCGEKQKLKDGGEITLNGGGTMFSAMLGSGKIRFLNK